MSQKILQVDPADTVVQKIRVTIHRLADLMEAAQEMGLDVAFSIEKGQANKFIATCRVTKVLDESTHVGVVTIEH